MTGMKILAIDDEPANIALLDAILSDDGFTQVRTVTESRLALAAYREFEPDLILLDLMMPPPDGFSILETLRAERTEIFLPIIVLTADASEATKIRALRDGATDFLLKPFDHLEMLLRLTNSLETRRLHLQLDLQRSALEDAIYASNSEVQRLQSELASVQL